MASCLGSFISKFEELRSLSNCDLTKEIIGIRLDKEGNRQIVILSKNDDVTLGQKILRCIGRGKLANIQTDLSKVASLLSQYNWDTTANLRHDSSEHQAYLKICQFANKALLSRGDATLINSIGQELKIENAFLNQIKQKQRTSSKITPSVRWNPEMQCKHISVQLQQIFHGSKVSIEITEHEGEVFADNEDAVSSLQAFSRFTVQVG